MKKMTKGRIAFQIINYTVLTLLALICLFPLLNILAMSFSSATAVSAGRVLFFPVEFNTYAYNYVIEKREFWQSLLKSVERVCIGVPFTMLFSGGLIPGYLLIQNLHMMDTIWALILPMAVPVYNIVLMLNFFRGIPKELEEAALIDGANQFQTCFQIYVPCAKPSIATLTLFTFISHWNSYFDGLIFSNFPDSYPLASFLYTVVVKRDMSLLSIEQIREMAMVDDRTIRCAQIFISLIPIMIIYPFAQKYFVKGMTVGSVKG